MAWGGGPVVVVVAADCAGDDFVDRKVNTPVRESVLMARED